MTMSKPESAYRIEALEAETTLRMEGRPGTVTCTECSYTDWPAWVEAHKSRSHPKRVDDRMVYCPGCEQAEVHETMAEVLYEGGTSREARQHVARFWRSELCSDCHEEAEERNARYDEGF